MSILSVFKTILKHLTSPPNKRRHERIPCRIKVHYFIGDETALQRGSATITDIHRCGLGFSEMQFFREDMQLRKNTKIKLYFSLPCQDGSFHDFEMLGKIKYLVRNQHGWVTKAGLSLEPISRREQKIFEQCISFLTVPRKI